MIILVVVALAALGALGFNAWRVAVELRRLGRSLLGLQIRLAPTLQQIARDGEAAAARAERLQARAAERRDARPGPPAGPPRPAP